MRFHGVVAAGLGMLLAGCGISGPGLDIGALELRPPQRGIYVGSLYYANGRPTTGGFLTSEAKAQVAIESLCDIQADLTVFGVANPVAEGVSDINLLYDVQVQTALNAVRGTLVTAGLSGNVSDYYEYQLVNVTKYAISEVAAQTVFDKMSAQRRCKAAIARHAQDAIYQVKATYVGDIVFKRKQGFGIDTSVEAKLAQVEPTIKATVSRSVQLGFSGKGYVFSFVPIARNGAGY